MQSDGLSSALSPVVYGDIALSTKTQYNTIKFLYPCYILDFIVPAVNKFGI